MAGGRVEVLHKKHKRRRVKKKFSNSLPKEQKILKSKNKVQPVCAKNVSKFVKKYIF